MGGSPFPMIICDFYGILGGKSCCLWFEKSPSTSLKKKSTKFDYSIKIS
jgi:hypothetical protein